MGKFFIVGRLTDREISIILRESATYKHNVRPAEIYSDQYRGIDRNIRDCLITKPNIQLATQTYNILQSIVIENYHHLNIDITNVGELQFAQYGVGGKFDWHGDVIPTTTGLCRGFTLSMQMTDPAEYSGGELLVDDHNDIVTINKTVGSYTIFPSYTRHQVNAVTQGQRDSIVAWIHVTPKELQWLKTNDK